MWGIWNGVTPRDGEATRRVATIERAVAPFFASQEWEPFYPMHTMACSPAGGRSGEQTVWTIVNRNEYDVSGPQMTVPHKDGMRYFDLYHGVELKPVMKGDDAVLEFATEGHGYGAVMAMAGEPDAGREGVDAQDGADNGEAAFELFA